MKNVLITGSEGFVGGYLYQEIKDICNVTGTYFIKTETPFNSFYLDFTDKKKVDDFFLKNQFDIIYHLAGQSSGGFSIKNPYETYFINVNGMLNILEAVRKTKSDTKIIFASSADVYGYPEYLPIDENHPLKPLNPYASSKFVCEEIAQNYSKNQNMDIVITRAFNHTGRNQNNNFFIPSLIENIKKANDKDTIKTGNLNILRDFSDVRDIVKGYRNIIDCHSGIYNLSSDKPVLLADIADYLVKKSNKNLFIEQDINLIRANEPKEFYGSSEKFRRISGWSSLFTIFETLDWMWG